MIHDASVAPHILFYRNWYTNFCWKNVGNFVNFWAEDEFLRTESFFSSFSIYTGHTTCEFDTGCHYTAVDLSYPEARSGAILKYLTDGRATFNDLGDPYDRVVFPEDPKVGWLFIFLGFKFPSSLR